MTMLETRSRQGHVVAELGGDIATGRLTPGTVLAPEALGERFGVSRTVVREAFRALEARGLIHARPRSGTVVAPPASWNLLDPEVIAWRGAGPEARQQLQDLLVLREAVEPAAAALAASRAGADQLAALAAACDALEAAARDRDAPGFVAADERFHHTLVEASANPVLAQLLRTIEATLTSRYVDGGPVFTDATPAAVARHRAIAEAVAARDPERAAEESTRLVREAAAEQFRSTATERAGGAR
jgi:DNA-binding FadR family transcriptional regulator